jgi:hypothetical protein
VTPLPEHTVLLPAILIVGVVLTVKVTTALLLQVPLTPNTVYVVFTDGVILMLFVVAPALHEYVEAPLPVNTAVCPLQIVVEPVILTASVLVTVTTATTVFVAGQPCVLLPVTEYDVVMVGVTTGPPFKYVYVAAPLGASVKLLPGQIEPPVKDNVGKANTVIVEMAVVALTQPLALLPDTV